jgi:Fe2+ or Zn2+ uptake regulation protein
MDETVTHATERGTDEQLVALLRARGQRVTSQRLVILRELARNRGHATAEEIRTAVAPDLPGISAPTVYASLELFVELGLARKLDIGSGGALFDGRIDPHQHTVCRVCRRVDDLDGSFEPSALIRAAERSGFHAERAEVIVSGLCARCARR